MMKNLKGWRHFRWLILAGALALVAAMAWPWVVHSQRSGLQITVNAQNHSTADTPFCGIGGGRVGDSLSVNVFTDHAGVTTGTAVFRQASRPPVTLQIDTIVTFTGGGLALIDSRNGNTVALWIAEGSAPVHVNVELPRGCPNTISTFTAGVDALTLLIELK